MVQKEEASGLEVGYRRNDKAIKDKLSCELGDDNPRVDRQGTAAVVTRDMRRKMACCGANLCTMKTTRRREIGFRDCQDRGSRIAEKESKSETQTDRAGNVIGDRT